MTTEKKPELHLDFNEMPIEVGDEVITIPPRSHNAGMHRLISATVKSFTPQGVRVEYIDSNRRKATTVVLCSETVFRTAGEDTTREVISSGYYAGGSGQWVPPVYRK